MAFTIDLLTSWFNDLNKKTDQINVEIFRIITNKYCRIKAVNRLNLDLIKIDDDSCKVAVRICDLLSIHSEQGFQSMESQILCITTLYNLINIIPKKDREIYLENIVISLTEWSNTEDASNANNFDSILRYDNSLHERNILSCILGIFQSDLIHRYYHSDSRSVSEVIIQRSIEISIKHCMKYSRYSHVSFKALLIISEKVSEWKIDASVLKDSSDGVLFVIFYNWENSITGVRELNSKILRVFLKLDLSVYKDILYNVLMMPWNRAKFYMLSEIVPHLMSIDKLSEDFHLHCIEGLRYGLKNSFFISSAKELYKILLQSLKSIEEWNHFYYDIFEEILFDCDYGIQLNLLNHWLLPTVKKYPEVVSVLLKDLKSSKDVSFPFLFILKTSRKNGHLLADWNSNDPDDVFYKKLIENGISSLDDDIRLQSFEIVCCTSKNTKIPSNEEFRMIESFLEGNVNQDCGVFRQNCLNCLGLFFIRVKDSLLHNQNRQNDRLEVFNGFFLWLRDFIIRNLSTEGNYQRKVSSLRILEIFMKSFCTPEGNEWKILNEEFRTEKIVNILLRRIDDQSGDIRDMSVNILIRYYSKNEYLLEKVEKLFTDGVGLCESSLFYEVEIGCSSLKLYFNLCKEFDKLKYFIGNADHQLDSHRKDALYSICNKKPLYGALSAIEVYLKHHCNGSISYENILKSIDLICVTVDYFLDLLALSCSQGNEKHPPSFAEMDQSIKLIISSSGYKFDSHQSNTQISNAEQLVLNNIWLNLKACSELSSTIIELFHYKLNEDDVKRCIDVNIKILTRCRHKGAIESAGTNIGRTVRMLTSEDNTLFKQILVDILEGFVSDVISEKTSGASITRRSAGLTILIHRFVSNDSQNNKPLFFIAIPKLLKYLTSQLNARIANISREEHDEDLIKQDIPEARALHLLCRTVTESSLSNYIMQFASVLFAICFEYFTDKQWQVRNGALQLYGSLIPKLVGQKTKSETETPTMTIDELFSHIPILWNIVSRALKSSAEVLNSTEKFHIHTGLIPILGFLSNTAKRYGIVLNIANPKIEELFPYLINLLNSPLYAVRKSAAKIVELFYDLNTFHVYCSRNGDFSEGGENFLHGHLLVLKYYTKHYNCMKKYYSHKYNKMYISLLSGTYDLIEKYKNGNNSFIVDASRLQVLYNLHGVHSEIDYLDMIRRVSRVFDNVKNGNGVIGLHHWCQVSVNFIFSHCNDELLSDILKFCIENYNRTVLSESILPAFKDRLKRKRSIRISKETFEQISNISYGNELNLHKIILEILYIIIDNSSENVDFNTEKLLEDNLSLYNEYYYDFVIPFITQNLHRKFIKENDMDVLIKIIQLSCNIKKSLDLNNYNVENKMFIVTGLGYLKKIITFLCESEQYVNNEQVFILKCDVFSSIFWLLQDEDRSVRYESSKISLIEKDFVTHPNNQLEILFSQEFLNYNFDNNAVIICQFLQVLIEKLSLNECHDVNVPNPFDHQIKNIYLEPLIVRNKLLNLQSLYEVHL